MKSCQVQRLSFIKDFLFTKTPQYMQKLSLLMMASAAALLSFAQGSNLSVGSKMPDVGSIAMKDVSGKDVTLEQLSTKSGLLVMFSCNTCPYVIKNQQRTHDILRYAANKGLGIAILNSNEAYRNNEDSYDAMKEYASKQQYEWAYAVDKNHVIADAFGATRTPECFLFDGNGVLVYHGAIDDSPADAAAVKRQHLRIAIDEMTNGQAISVPTSRSVGCSIKRLSKP
jgi:thioredoxin-related protein